MSTYSWTTATADFLLAVVGLSVIVFPALSVAHALVTGRPLDAWGPGVATLVVATGGSYPFVAGDWAFDRLWRFVAGLVVSVGLASLVGLVVLARLDVPLPDPTVARALVLAVGYPVAAVVAFRDRTPPAGVASGVE